MLLDPLNYRFHRPSLLGDLEEGRVTRLVCYLASGGVCGILWEFWNYRAAARWVYIFPMWQRGKIFEMPLPGFLGFLPFALECFVMYAFVGTVRGLLVRFQLNPPLPARDFCGGRKMGPAERD